MQERLCFWLHTRARRKQLQVCAYSCTILILQVNANHTHLYNSILRTLQKIIPTSSVRIPKFRFFTRYRCVLWRDAFVAKEFYMNVASDRSSHDGVVGFKREQDPLQVHCKQLEHEKNVVLSTGTIWNPSGFSRIRWCDAIWCFVETFNCRELDIFIYQ